MAEHTLRHEHEIAERSIFPPSSAGAYSGDEVLMIPLGLLGVVAFLGALMFLFLP